MLKIEEPSEREDAYFTKKEFELKKKRAEERHKKMTEEEKKNLKKLHYMCCPKCGKKLIEIDYKGVRIDKCSGCSGIWLDKGELETITQLEKSIVKKFLDNFNK
jgi:hypothetical protein